MPDPRTDRQTNPIAALRRRAAPEGLLEAIAAGDENLRIWCIQHRAELRAALVYEGMNGEAAAGVCNVLWFVFDECERLGLSELEIAIDGEDGLAGKLGKNFKTARRWLDAACEWRIVNEDRSRGRKSKLRIDWAPILMRVRAAAAGGACDAPPLFSPVPRKGLQSPGTSPLTSPQRSPITGDLLPRSSKEEKESSSLKRDGQRKFAFPEFAADNRACHDRTHQELAEIKEELRKVADAAITAPKSDRSAAGRPTIGPEWQQVRELMRRAKITNPDVLIGEGVGNGWTQPQILQWLVEQDELASDAGGEWPYLQGLVRRHLREFEPGSRPAEKCLRPEFVAAQHRMRESAAAIAQQSEASAKAARERDAAARGADLEAKFGAELDAMTQAEKDVLAAEHEARKGWKPRIRRAFLEALHYRRYGDGHV